jgi:Putative zinc-finger
MTCPETISIGVYVLGALDPQERLGTERHVAECADCRDELVRLAHLPGLLHRLTLDDLSAPDTGPEPDLELGRPTAAIALTEVRATPPHPSPGRRLTPAQALLAAAVLAVIVVAGGLLGLQLLPPQAPGPVHDATWSATTSASGIDATAQLTSRPWGTGIRLRMQDAEAGQTCQLVVHADSGEAETAGWWTTGPDAGLDVPGSTSIRLSDIDRIDVVRSDNTVLTTLTDGSR